MFEKVSRFLATAKLWLSPHEFVINSVSKPVIRYLCIFFIVIIYVIIGLYPFPTKLHK